MTNVGLLSTKYESLTDTLRAFNNSVIALKKVLYNIQGIESIQKEEIDGHLLIIKNLLAKSLEVITNPNTNLPEEEIAAQIVADRLRDMRTGDLDDLIEEMNQIIRQLKTNWKNLDDDEVLLLDSICWLIDSEASLTFRRIWRR